MINADGHVVHEVLVSLLVEEVFEFFTDASRLVSWIGLSASLAAVEDGEFSFEVVPGQFCRGSYVEITRPRFVSFTWGWTDPAWHLPPGSSLVSVELRPVGDGTRVVLTHSHLPGDLRPIHDEGWTRFLARLLAVTVGDEPPPYPERESP